jgi:hypothetical protein
MTRSPWTMASAYGECDDDELMRCADPVRLSLSLTDRQIDALFDNPPSRRMMVSFFYDKARRSLV